MKLIMMVAGTILLAGQSVVAGAQDSAAVFVDVSPCLPLTLDSERHACFDRLVDIFKAEQRSLATAAVPAPQEPSTAPAVRPSPPPPVPTPEVAVTNFGTETPAQARVQANDAGEQEMFDRIVKMEEREPDRWLITLESGQVWYQTNSQRMRLRAGMDVRIYPSPIGGSFRMARTDGPSTGFIQVRRVE